MHALFMTILFIFLPISCVAADSPHPGTGAAAPVVLLHETFNDGNLGDRGWYDNTDIKLSRVAGHAPESGSCAEFSFAGGAMKPSSGGAMRRRFADSDSVYVSYWQKYGENWQEQAGGAGHHEIYLLTNQDAAYANLAFTRLTTYLESWGTAGKAASLTPHVSFQDGANIEQGSINVDLTKVTEHRSANGCNGQLDHGFRATCYNSGNGRYWNGKFLPAAPESLALGKWHHIEAYLKLNSIVDGKGVADGIVTLWLDGRRIMNHTNVLMRTGRYPEMKFNQIVIAPFMGNGAPGNQSFWLDDLLVATARPVP